MLVCIKECLGFKEGETFSDDRFSAICNGILGRILSLIIDNQYIPIEMLNNFEIR
jgi:hypothetical protein